MRIRAVWTFLSKSFRKRRMTRFMQQFHPTEETRILDVGGTLFNWQFVDCRCRVTLLNLVNPSHSGDFPDNYEFVEGDGTDLRYDDNAFDIVFSNSVIEHVGSYERQRLFAAESLRVGKAVWVQTPARCFFLEPHLVTPFIHFFPVTWQRKLLRRFTLWGWLTRPSPERIEQFLASVRLLNYREMRELFPGCEIRRERFLLLTKSYIAVREG